MRLLRVCLCFALATVVLGGSALTAAAKEPTSPITFALPPGSTPNYIFPLMNPVAASNANIFDLQYQLYRPLYWFGIDGRPSVNFRLSLGKPPTYSNGGRTVTIELNHYLWSDGVPVTNRDVEFWMNMVIANKDNWYGYTPGAFPDNVSGMNFPANTPNQFSITFNKAYNHTWVLSNELSQIIPMPQHAWDKTSSRGTVNDYDTTTSGAIQVYQFLDGQSTTLSTYATNPLWSVVDGPWKVAAYASSTGYTEFVRNDKYTGPGKPQIKYFAELPFTSDTSEFDALRAGSLDYGYLPIEDLDETAVLAKLGYKLHPWSVWGINYILDNFTNPQVGPLFKQLYFRQALQRLVNQPEMIKSILHGEGYPTYGPVPLRPTSAYVTTDETHNLYHYNVGIAKNLLASHGWKVRPDGVDTCIRPGTAAIDCGAGIKQGKVLEFTLQYTTGSAVFSAMMQVVRSAWSLAGIGVTLDPSAPSQVFSELSPCQPTTGFGCHWQLISYGSFGHSYTYSPNFYPTGDEIFAMGSGSDFNGYSNPTADKYIRATYVQPGLAPLFQYENYLAKQLPVIWLPNFYSQLSEIKSSLHGTLPQDPNLNIYPQYWTDS
jgi:peptide/nickel transport system substrate-binding protein